MSHTSVSSGYTDTEALMYADLTAGPAPSDSEVHLLLQRGGHVMIWDSGFAGPRLAWAGLAKIFYHSDQPMYR